MAMEVAERNYRQDELYLVGIKENGIYIARKIAAYLKDVFSGKLILLELSLDKKNPGEVILSSQNDFNGKNILLVDDVANSGRTMLYALKPLIQQLPAQIETLVLVERTHKRFPIAVDYVGLSVATTSQENIEVKVEDAEITGAWMKVGKNA